jgi:hypothetical protein
MRCLKVTLKVSKEVILDSRVLETRLVKQVLLMATCKISIMS